MSSAPYGFEDASYRAAGEYEGILKLCQRFYEYMDSLPEARVIRAMHPADLAASTDKLTRFLCGWLGGPRLFMEKYGPINIPSFHQQFDINVDERDAWLLCMEKAVAEQPFAEDFKVYLMRQLGVPAERVRMASQMVHTA